MLRIMVAAAMGGMIAACGGSESPTSQPTEVQEEADISVPLAKQKFLNVFEGITQQMDGTKPTIVGIHFGSRGDLLDTGYLEETFCTSGYNVVTGSGTECIQRSTPTDFSLQAILHQAALEAIAQQNSVNVSAVLVEYWLTDRVTPGSTFPNLAVSIRNKPAEAVVRQWFQRP